MSSSTEEAQELQIRLDEALALADDKDKRIYELEMQTGELEMQIADLKRNPPSAVAKDMVKMYSRLEELVQENDSLRVEIDALKEALRANIKASGFESAKEIPKQPWVAAINALNLYVPLFKASRHAIEHNEPWRKLYFDVDVLGQLRNAQLEGTKTEVDRTE